MLSEEFPSSNWSLSEDDNEEIATFELERNPENKIKRKATKTIITWEEEGVASVLGRICNKKLSESKTFKWDVKNKKRGGLATNYTNLHKLKKFIFLFCWFSIQNNLCKFVAKQPP